MPRYPSGVENLVTVIVKMTGKRAGLLADAITLIGARMAVLKEQIATITFDNSLGFSEHNKTRLKIISILNQNSYIFENSNSDSLLD